MKWFLGVLVALVLVPGAGRADDKLSADEIGKKLSNPISNIWSLGLQNNMTFVRGGPSHSYRGLSTTNFQPVMPVPLTEDWNVIVRPVFNFTSTPTVDASGDFDRASGIGDTSLITLLSPKQPTGELVWGVGPTFIFPTNKRDDLSGRKYAIGPAAVGLFITDKWVVGLFPQYWWSYSGTDNRREVSEANIQYFMWRSLGGGWQIGMSPNITYDRKADGPNAWTVPIGLGVSRVLHFGSMPVKIALEGQAMVVHPDDLGSRWNIRFTITPVLPAMVKKALF